MSQENDTPDVLTLIEQSFSGLRGKDQQRIAATGLEWIALILRKNADYGSSVWRTPLLAPDTNPGVAIRVRMSDKIHRLQRLLAGNEQEVNESIDDTIRDLGAYCLLYLARGE